MLKRLITVLGLVLLVSACDGPTQIEGLDGYKFGQKQYTKNVVIVRTEIYQTREEFLEAAKKYSLSDQTAAFTVLDPPHYNSCTIHMLEPSKYYYPEFVGHEALHCFYGQWHTDNDSRQ